MAAAQELMKDNGKIILGLFLNYNLNSKILTPLDEEGMPEVKPVIMQAAREIEPAALAEARFENLTEQSRTAVVIQYSKDLHQWALSKHALHKHDPVTGAIPSGTNVPVLPIQDDSDVVAFYVNVKVLEKALQAYTGSLLTVTPQMQKTAQRILSSFGATEICEAFKSLYENKLRGYYNEFAQCTACGNPSCPQKDAINLSSIEDYANCSSSVHCLWHGQVSCLQSDGQSTMHVQHRGNRCCTGSELHGRYA